MLLDKLAFLEQAVKTACEEVIEEADALTEGADAKLSANVLKTIANDLLHSIENWDMLQLEEESKEKEEQEVTEREEEKHFELFPGERIFKPGERVQIKNPTRIPFPRKKIIEAMGYSFEEDKFFAYLGLDDEDEATVLKVDYLPSSLRPLYVIETNERKFFIFQDGLEEI